jgi:hypothetical protein
MCGLCERCRGDRRFWEGTDAPVARFRKELLEALREAEKLSAEMVALAGR